MKNVVACVVCVIFGALLFAALSTKAHQENFNPRMSKRGRGRNIRKAGKTGIWVGMDDGTMVWIDPFWW